MCFFRVKTPSVSTVTTESVGLTGRDIVDKTTAPEPDSPLLGGMDTVTADATTSSATKKKKGKSALRISPVASGYNPMNGLSS